MTLHVDTTGGGSGANWGTPATLSSVSPSSQEEVRMKSGTYVRPTGGFAWDDAKYIGGFDPALTGTNGTIAGRNLKDHVTILDGQDTDRCVDVSADTGAVEIDGIKFYRGSTTGDGTAILIGAATLIVRNFWADQCQGSGNGAQFRAASGDVTLENGIISNGGTGLYMRDTSTGLVKNVTFYNNINNGWSAGEDADAISAVHSTTTITVHNSIFDGLNDEFLSERASGTIVATYCSLNGETKSGTGNADEDPLLVLPGSDNFLLQRGSPCINAADGANAIAADRFGRSRIYIAGIAVAGVGAPPWGDRGPHQYPHALPAPFHGITG